jgi:predicted dehydrogenase
MNKILLIGCGYWGKNWYKTILSSQYELVGVVDPNPIIQVDVPLFNSIEEVNIEYTHAILAINAQLHTETVSKLNIPQNNILVEKPCGIDYNDAKLIKNTFPGYIFLYSDEYQYIKNNLNKIGKPQYWKSIRASMGPKVRSDVSILEDYMIHDLYLYYDLFGESKLVNKTFLNEFSPPIQSSSLHLELKSSIPGYFYSSWNYPIKERKIIIKGDKGCFIWENDNLYLDNTYYEGDKVIEGDIKKIQTTSKSNLTLELEFFILNNKPDTLITDIWDLIKSINYENSFR